MHADDEVSDGFEAELGVQAVGGNVSEEAGVGTGGGDLMDVLYEAGDDGFAEAAMLVGGVDGDIDDLEGEASVADDAAHADEFRADADGDCEEGVGETDGCAFGAFGAEAGLDAEGSVFVWSRGLEEEGVRAWGRG